MTWTKGSKLPMSLGTRAPPARAKSTHVPGSPMPIQRRRAPLSRAHTSRPNSAFRRRPTRLSPPLSPFLLMGHLIEVNALHEPPGGNAKGCGEGKKSEEPACDKKRI